MARNCHPLASLEVACQRVPNQLPSLLVQDASYATCAGWLHHAHDTHSLLISLPPLLLLLLLLLVLGCTGRGFRQLRILLPL